MAKLPARRHAVASAAAAAPPGPHTFVAVLLATSMGLSGAAGCATRAPSSTSPPTATSSSGSPSSASTSSASPSSASQQSDKGWPGFTSQNIVGLSPHFCTPPRTQTAGQQDHLLRFAAIVRRELQASGSDVAFIGRSGLQLGQFDIRYSHSGLALRSATSVPWSVRQLYFACDQGRPRIFDQGIGGFLFNADEPRGGFVSLVIPGPERARELTAAASDAALTLKMQTGQYSANANPFSTRYQNCNQWVVELMAVAWGHVPHADRPGTAVRADAQQWMRQTGYDPDYVRVPPLLMLAGPFVPLVHFDDHPQDERFDHRYRLSLPAAIERFMQQRDAGARRVELCRTADSVVVRRGWQGFAGRCEPGPGDDVIALGPD